MVTNSDLLHILSTQDHPSQPEILTFFNYLSNYCEPNAPFNASILEQFFRRAISFPHWREKANRAQLLKAIDEVLRQVDRQCPNACLDIDAMIALGQFQEFEIERLSDLKDIISRHLESQLQQGDRFRLISQPGHRVLAIVLSQAGALRLSVYTNWAMLRAGRAVPLIDDLNLYYTAQLELSTRETQHIELAPNIVCRWKVSENGQLGQILRGYTLQRFEVLNGGPLTNYPNLFYPVKRLEQYFINRKTDPLYLELTSLLEKASALIQSRHPDGPKFAQNTLKRAQMAFEHIFIEDRLMGLLIRDLTRLLADTVKEGPVWEKNQPLI